MKELHWSAGRIVLALAHRYWASKLIMTEFEIERDRADFVVITKHNYLTEIEIKVTVEDWKKDLKKSKWNGSRPFVSRFFYAIPQTLEGMEPPGLPEGSGIMVVRSSRRADFVSVTRKATRFKAQKISEKRIQRAYRNSYFRYWNQQMILLRQQRNGGEEKVKNVTNASPGVTEGKN